MKTRIFEDSRCRYMHIDPFGDPSDVFVQRDLVTVRQSLRDGNWLPAGVNWASSGHQPVDDVKIFVAAQIYAVKVAELWNAQRAGKTAAEIDPATEPSEYGLEKIINAAPSSALQGRK